jgi:5'(3')-deoxyribonucleotidase
MRILCDIDSVMAQTMKHWLSIYNKKYFDNLIVEDVTLWDIDKVVKPSCGMAIYNIIKEPGFFYDLEPMPGMVKAIGELQAAGHEIILVSSSPRKGKTSAYDKVRWVEKYLPDFNTEDIVFTHRKDVVSGDLMLDDAPHNIEAFPGLTCVFDQPWNRKVRSNFRVSDWDQFTTLVDRISGVKHEG